MKRFLALLFVCCLTGLGAAENESASEQPLRPEEIKKIREEVANIYRALSPETLEIKAGKNMADVADRALSLLSSSLGTVSQMMQKVAPEVWRVMIRQQYAAAVGEPLRPLLLFFVALVLGLFLKKFWVYDPNDPDQCIVNLIFAKILPIGGGMAFAVWFAIVSCNSVQMLINPEYYAFRDLLRIVLSQ